MKNCKQCNCELPIKKHSTKRTFCSVSCSMKYRHSLNQGQTKIDVKCHKCSKDFQVGLGKYNNRIKNGNGRFFCSISCGSKFYQNKELNIGAILFNKVRGNRNKDKNITKEYLQELWDNQKGICAISKIKMEIYKNGKKKPRQCSVDRIDNSKGYIVGNIQLVCLIANYAKNTFSENDLIDFCKALCHNLS